MGVFKEKRCKKENKTFPCFAETLLKSDFAPLLQKVEKIELNNIM